MQNKSPHVVVIGAGFSGLAAAYEIVKAGGRVTVLERDSNLGGLASGFDVGGQVLERFYHHWFTSDRAILDLVREMGLEDRVLLRPTRTGLYYAHNIFRLSSPLDLLRFTPLNLIDRIRLGLMVIRARRVKDWKSLESLTAREWLSRMCGPRVFKLVWEPLLVGKFGHFADEVSAVWFWNKIALRGNSRGKGGREMLAYYRGGFVALADALGAHIAKNGGSIRTGVTVSGINVVEGRVVSVETSAGKVEADAVIATPALPIIADIVGPHMPKEFVARLRRVKYLANVCLVLALSRSLSDIYWLNVNDPSFPFVGIIEHTNLESSATYAGQHIVYLSRYLLESDPIFRMSNDELLAYALPHIERMFPTFKREWILRHFVWHALHSQPITERHYSDIIPSVTTPIGNFFIATMAQVYPEDRGTNYAIRDGRKAGAQVMQALTAR
jgi:protoporphyrinogen oxidase